MQEKILIFLGFEKTDAVNIHPAQGLPVSRSKQSGEGAADQPVYPPDQREEFGQRDRGRDEDIPDRRG